MCNLYSVTNGQQAIREATKAMRDTIGNLPPLPGIIPDYAAPIVRTGAGSERELVKARWGMPSPVFVLQGKKVDKGVTNVRNTASPHWRRWLVPGARCVVCCHRAWNAAVPPSGGGASHVWLKPHAVLALTRASPHCSH